MNKKILICLSFFCIFIANSYDYTSTNSWSKFLEKAKLETGYTEKEITEILLKARKDKDILRKISKPAEKTMPWFKYKKIFSDKNRIKNGKIFYKKNKIVLDEAYQIYGVPQEIIVAILGVETRYAKIMGSDRVIDALATIGFYYPKRERFFLAELSSFLKLARQQDIDPLSVKGSYAGAMGMAQFMPSSYLNYAVDYEKDGKIDLWKNPNDAIFSIANYLNKNGWEKDSPIVDKALLITQDYKGKINHKPFIPLLELKNQGVFLNSVIATDDTEIGIIKFKKTELDYIYFVTFNNFKVITTYNTSPMYAMAVYELANKVKISD